MRVAVCVKCVPASSSPRLLDASTGRLVRSSLVLNPPDLHALEAALQVRDRTGADVVVVSVAAEAAARALRNTFALGVDCCVLVCDDAIAGSDMLATSRVLAAALSQCHCDLVLFGQEASDANGALIWAAVAERLGLPLISWATSVEIVDGAVVATRTTEDGTQVVEAPMPAVIAVAASANEPRHAALRDVIAAKSKACEYAGLAELAIDPSLVGSTGSGTAVREHRAAPSARGRCIVDDWQEGARLLVRLLTERELL